MRKQLLIFVSYILLAWSLPAWGLEEGDSAPPLSIAQWLLGQPVNNIGMPSDHIRVVAFWATWSQPACESLFHLSQIQTNLRSSNVAVVAVSAESVKKVEEFVSLHRDRLDLRVAVDDQHKTTNAYMKAVSQQAIPHVFVIDTDGVFAWQGHPEEVKGVLDQILAGTFEITKLEKKEEVDTTLPEPEPDDDRTLLEEAGVEELFQLLERVTRAENWKLAILLLDAIVKKIPDSPEAEYFLGQKFMLLYENLHDYTAAENFAKEVLDQYANKPEVLNAVAWALLARGDFETLNHRWPKIAHQAARMAFEASKGENPEIIDTYARSLYLLGSPKQALDWQHKAVGRLRKDIEKAEEKGSDRERIQNMKANLRDLEATLDYYKEIVTIKENMK